MYLGFDSQVHNVADSSVPQTRYLSDMSIWDVHRSQYPLLALLVPDLYEDIAQSLVQMYVDTHACALSLVCLYACMLVCLSAFLLHH